MRFETFWICVPGVLRHFTLSPHTVGISRHSSLSCIKINMFIYIYCIVSFLSVLTDSQHDRKARRDA